MTTGNAPTHTCSYFCDKPECIKAQRDELRDKLAALESQPVPVEPEPMPEIWLASLGLPLNFKLYPQRVIDTLQSALQHITEDKERLYQLNVDCEALIIRQREERKKQQERAEAAESALQRVTEERDAARKNYQFMVDRAADEKLDGYRELGAKCASLEERAEKAESLNRRMVELLKEPSEGMIAAGYPPNDERAQSWDVTEVFKAMSAELLKEATK